MSYAQIAKTAGAKRYIEESEAADRAAARRVSPAGARVLSESGLTCDEWLRRYLDTNSRSIKRPSNTESEYVEIGREIEGPQAAEVGVVEGMGDPPRQDGRAGGTAIAGKEGAQDEGWAEDAYPEAGGDTQAGGMASGGFDTPF